MSEPVIKILIIGPSNVGKSALLKRYCGDDFDPDDAAATVGIDFRVKRLSVRGTTYRVTLLDTAGQERFRALSTSYYRGAHGIVFVYDISSRASLVQLDAFFAEAQEHTGPAAAAAAATAAAACQICVVGAKLDRADAGSRAVTEDEGLALATRYHEAMHPSSGDDADAVPPLFFETSARTGVHVREPFVALVDRIVSSGSLAPLSSSSSSAARRLAGVVSLQPPSDGGGYLPGCAC